MTSEKSSIKLVEQFPVVVANCPSVAAGDRVFVGVADCSSVVSDACRIDDVCNMVGTLLFGRVSPVASTVTLYKRFKIYYRTTIMKIFILKYVHVRVSQNTSFYVDVGSIMMSFQVLEQVCCVVVNTDLPIAQQAFCT